MRQLTLFVWENDDRILVRATDFSCVICGLCHDYWRVAGMLYEDRGGDMPLKIGDVCLYCLAAGKEGAAERARARAEYLRTDKDYRQFMKGKEKYVEAKAARRDFMADRVDQMAEWATAEELRVARAALAEMEEGLEEE